jgi:hypothetical protein
VCHPVITPKQKRTAEAIRWNIQSAGLFPAAKPIVKGIAVGASRPLPCASGVTVRLWPGRSRLIALPGDIFLRPAKGKNRALWEEDKKKMKFQWLYLV